MYTERDRVGNLGAVVVGAVSPLVVVRHVVDGDENDVFRRRPGMLPVSASVAAMPARKQLQRGRRHDRLYAGRRRLRNVHSKQHRVFVPRLTTAAPWRCCTVPDKRNKSSTQSFAKSRVTIPHGRKWTRPLRVLSVQRPLQTSPITQPPLRYIHTTQTDTRRRHIPS